MKALLFDLDGTLVDSIPIWIETNIRVLKELGCEIDHQTFLQDCYQKGLHFAGILEKCGLDSTLNDEFYPKRDNLYIKLLTEKAEWIDSSEKTLTALAPRFPLGLMTGSRRSFIDAADQKLHLSKFFGAIITYEDTGEKMKPDPYGLLLLAKRMKVNPEDCLYIGDQASDPKAARNAGMKSCLIPLRETPEGATKEADVVIRTINDLPGVLEGEV